MTKIKESIIHILKEFEQTDYKKGGVSIPSEMYDAIADKIDRELIKPQKVDEGSIENSELCVASINSRFNFGQQVWLLHNNRIISGTVQAIKGCKSYLYENTDIELQVRPVLSDEVNGFWEKEENCFENKQALIDFLLNGC